MFDPQRKDLTLFLTTLSPDSKILNFTKTQRLPAQLLKENSESVGKPMLRLKHAAKSKFSGGSECRR